MTVYVLRTCASDMTSHGGFKWPESGPVEAPDWDPKPECGNGLHGLLWGEGHGALLDWSPSARWLVIKVPGSDIVDLDGKVKFPRGEVVFCGDRKGATDEIIRLGARGAVVGAMVIAGDYGTATAGYRGTATVGEGGTAMAGNDGTAKAGYSGTAMAGNDGTATAGEDGTAMAGDYGTAMAGDHGTAKAGYSGTANAGDCGIATAGHYGTAMAGDYGIATAGHRGTAKAGHRGTSMAGNDGMATAGEGGIISIWHWDGDCIRLITGYIGDNGLKPNTPYRLNEDGKFVEAENG